MVFHLQQEGTEPLIFGRTELTNHVTLQWQELVRIKACASTACVVILAPCNDARMIFTRFSISRISARLFFFEGEQYEKNTR